MKIGVCSEERGAPFKGSPRRVSPLLSSVSRPRGRLLYLKRKTNTFLNVSGESQEGIVLGFEVQGYVDGVLFVQRRT